jgi:biopolymer transport protein TolQ
MKDKSTGMLSATDIDSVATMLFQERRKESEKLEKNIYILSMVVTLAPFLGLLGTVWGILMTFSHMQGGHAGSNQMVLAGISLALATTVLGLIDAIPALIGFHILKQKVRKIDFEMESFSTDILSAIELNYRKVDL